MECTSWTTVERRETKEQVNEEDDERWLKKNKDEDKDMKSYQQKTRHEDQRT